MFVSRPGDSFDLKSLYLACGAGGGNIYNYIYDPLDEQEVCVVVLRGIKIAQLYPGGFGPFPYIGYPEPGYQYADSGSGVGGDSGNAGYESPTNHVPANNEYGAPQIYVERTITIPRRQRTGDIYVPQEMVFVGEFGAEWSGLVGLDFWSVSVGGESRVVLVDEVKYEKSGCI